MEKCYYNIFDTVTLTDWFLIHDLWYFKICFLERETGADRLPTESDWLSSCADGNSDFKSLSSETHGRREQGFGYPSVLEYLRGFNGDAALLLVFACVCEPRLPSPCWGDDACFTHQGVCQCGLAVIHVSDHRHVPDVGLLVHDRPDLLDREVHLGGTEQAGWESWEVTWELFKQFSIWLMNLNKVNPYQMSPPERCFIHKLPEKVIWASLLTL